MLMEMFIWMVKSVFSFLQLPGKLVFEIITVMVEVGLLVMSRCNRRLLVLGIIMIAATECLNLFAEDTTVIGAEWLILIIRMLYIMAYTAEGNALAMAGALAVFVIVLKNMPTLRALRLSRLYGLPPSWFGCGTVRTDSYRKYAHCIG